MQTFIMPKNLVQKWTIYCRCMKCGTYIFPIIATDGTYYGAQYFGHGLPYDRNDKLWKCDSCCGVKREEYKPKERIGFKVE